LNKNEHFSKFSNSIGDLGQEYFSGVDYVFIVFNG
jgi:hypothetical protein